MTRSFTHRGRTFVVPRTVFHPRKHLSGVAFADHLDDLVPTASRTLDLGTGCGILAAAMAERADAVVATDVNDRAVACARQNLAGLPVDVRLGDMFSPVTGERFDVVITNPPYDVGRGNTNFASPDFLRRFAEQFSGFSDRVVVGFPADEAARLTEVGLPVSLWRRVQTTGADLGIFINW